MATLEFLYQLPSPCYAVDEEALVENLELLAQVQQRTGCKILLAQKGFAMFALYPLIGRYLAGTAASSLFEARLGREEMGGECHIYSPAYREEEFGAILSYCDHVGFNSVAQYERFKGQVAAAGRPVSCGLRINPEYSEQKHAIYDPCAPGSRLGITAENFPEALPEGIEGLHLHTLCEQNADALEHTLARVVEKFGRHLQGLRWLNLGGGHHITRPGYDVERLVRCIDILQQKFGLQVYLEPGEAVALNTGFLLSTVLDTMKNGIDIAILDTSAVCHMPDVLEMPYRPEIIGAGAPGEFPYTYRLGGPTCLAGDVIGDYSFPRPLQPGDRLVFCDMAHYTMVKNNTFNGMNLPAIVLYGRDGTARVVKTFGYEDFKSRLS